MKLIVVRTIDISCLYDLSFIILDASLQKRKLSSGGLSRGKSLKSKDSEVKMEPEVNESASYLIDKMFSSGIKSNTAKSSVKSPKTDRFSEHAMYKEAKLFEFGKENTKDNSSTKKNTKSGSTGKPENEKKPKASSDGSKKKDEDNVSESGTYTIEADSKPSQEEEKARDNIDKAFGITDDGYLSQTSAESGLKNQEQIDMKIEDIEDQIEELEKARAQGAETDSLDVDVGSDVLTELKIVEEGVSMKNC